jgi:hypothetical protein
MKEKKCKIIILLHLNIGEGIAVHLRVFNAYLEALRFNPMLIEHSFIPMGLLQGKDKLLIFENQPVLQGDTVQMFGMNKRAREFAFSERGNVKVVWIQKWNTIGFHDESEKIATELEGIWFVDQDAILNRDKFYLDAMVGKMQQVIDNWSFQNLFPEEDHTDLVPDEESSDETSSSSSEDDVIKLSPQQGGGARKHKKSKKKKRATKKVKKEEEPTPPVTTTEEPLSPKEIAEVDKELKKEESITVSNASELDKFFVAGRYGSSKKMYPASGEKTVLIYDDQTFQKNAQRGLIALGDSMKKRGYKVIYHSKLNTMPMRPNMDLILINVDINEAKLSPWFTNDKVIFLTSDSEGANKPKNASFSDRIVLVSSWSDMMPDATLKKIEAACDKLCICF